MIDCESEVYTRVVNLLRESYEDINTSSEFILSPSAFPYVSIIMTDSYTAASFRTTLPSEGMTECEFEVNIYSNKTSGKKSECKAIAQIVDNAFQSMNFRRTALTPIQTDDTSIYRLVATYGGMTDGTNFYRR